MALYAPESARVRQIGIYVRISQDREGAGLGVERQEDDCRKLIEYKSRAAGEEWHVHRVYIDNDVSASSKKKRKDFDAMMEDLRAGVITLAISWHVDRLTRKPQEMETLIAESEKYGFGLATVQGEIDLSTATGRLMARQLGAFARYEVEHKAARQRAANAQAAAGGAPWSGGHRPFGYTADRLELVDEEAAVLRAAAAEVVATGKIGPVVEQLNARGITTSTGGRWRISTLRKVLLGHRIIGIRKYHGRLYPAAWPPIIDPATQQQLIAILDHPDRKRKDQWDGRRVYLLTGGLAMCGSCGARLLSQPSHDNVRGYVCQSRKIPYACGGIRIRQEWLEDDVAERVLARLASPKIRAKLAAASKVEHDETIAEQIVRDEEKLRELARRWANDDIDPISYNEARGMLSERIDTNRGKIAQTAARMNLPALTARDLATWWHAESTSVDMRRDLVMTVLEKVIVNRATKPGSRRFDPDRIEYVWR